MNINTETKSFVISYDNLEAAIIEFMCRVRAINPDNEEIISIDLGIPLNEEGLIEFDAEVVSPRRKTTPESNVIQLRLPHV